MEDSEGLYRKADTFLAAIDRDYTSNNRLAKWYKRFDWGERTGVSPTTLHSYINLGLVSLPFSKEICMGGAGILLNRLNRHINRLSRSKNYVDLKKRLEIYDKTTGAIVMLKTSINDWLRECRMMNEPWGRKYEHTAMGRLAQSIKDQTRRS